MATEAVEPPEDDVDIEDTQEHNTENERQTQEVEAVDGGPQAYDFDLIVIGSGPAGQQAAFQAARAGKRVAIIEKRATVGGVSTHTGTIPSKTLREAIIDLTGHRQVGIYGAAQEKPAHITMHDLIARADYAIRRDIEVTRHLLQRHGIEVYTGKASLIDAHKVRIRYTARSGEDEFTAAFILIATGTHVDRPPDIPFDGQTVLTSDDILHLDHIPRSLIVIGGGIIGCEYASMFAMLGVQVTLVDRQSRLLPFVDHEIVDALVYHLRERHVTTRLGEAVQGVEVMQNRGSRQHVRVRLEEGRELHAEKALYTVGRLGNTTGLNLEAVGLRPDRRGRLMVNRYYQTDVPTIYAAGDVIGFPNLASSSMEQGRRAVCHAFGLETHSTPELFPYGIYTIPEISVCGLSEEDLIDDGVPHEVGKAAYREVARGQILGDLAGMLKLTFHRETRKLLGVHLIGEGASELVHIGQAVMAFGGTLDYFDNAIFNYPTLSECYRAAAANGLKRLV